jgi:nicotinamide-nucleotide amidase
MPRIRPYLPARVYVTSVVRTIGIGESAAAQILDDLIQLPDPIVATYAKDDGIHVHVTSSAESEAEARALVVETEREVVRRLERYAYTTAGLSLPAALLGLLRERDLTVAVAERGTGGRFGALMSGDPNGGEVLAGSLTYPRSATSDVASAASSLAVEARSHFRTSLGVGLIADVSAIDQNLFEGTGAVALRGAFAAGDTFSLRATYDEIGRRTALNAADLLRRATLGLID